MTPLHLKVVSAFTAIDTHKIDVVKRLADSDIESVYDFNWQKHLRFYWDEENDDCLIKQVNAVFHYGYELISAPS